MKPWTERIIKRATEHLQKEGKTVDQSMTELATPVEVDTKKIKDDLKAKEIKKK